jgi:serine/threonine-protein kinase
MTAAPSCPECGAAAPAQAVFCPRCGTRLESVLSPGDARKLVTIVFCDLVGSTALGEHLDPEALRHVQLRYFETCQSALVRHGGSVEKFIGDAVLSVFGTPVAREDDATRACRAALELVDSVRRLNVELEADWGVALAVRTGVNTGLVVAGDPSRGQVLVTGDAVNTAARLEQAAGEGEILVGPTTRELLGEEGVCIPVPPLSLKGKSEPLPAWRLMALHAATRGAPGRRTTPLIGRREELAQILSWLEATGPDAPGGLCLVAGAPGIGKTRLVAEAAERTTRSVLWSRCPPRGEGIVYAPLADWLEGAGEDTLRTLGASDLERLRFAVGQGDTSATAEGIESAARSFVSGLVGGGGVLLVAEDVQGVEPAMRDLLVTLSRTAGVAVLVTARTEVLEQSLAALDEATTARIALQPLPSEAASELLAGVSADLDPSDGEVLLGLAHGNPLLIEQLARHAAEGGALSEMPPGIEAILQARIESLSPEERSVAERGAVMGPEFWDSGVAALAPDAPAPDAALALLTSRELVVEGRALGAPSAPSPTLSRVFGGNARPYSFANALLRESVYRTTPMLRRADLHERLANLLEEGAAPDELVAFHLERASLLRSELRRPDERLAARAAEHFERAGERAIVRQDNEAARALLTRAAALLHDPDAQHPERGTGGRATGGTGLVSGDVVGGFRIRSVAGRGGMGIVYRADDLALGRQVALKVIAPGLARDARFRDRFSRETRIAASLEHANVVPVYAAGEEGGQLYIAMRFIEGTDLQQLLREGALPAERAVAIVAQVADALDAAHARGLVHRDVKPANVLVAAAEGREHAYLTDFGLTRNEAAGDGLTKTGEWVGTLAYLAPEQILGEPVDARADVYALGAVLYQCVTGRLPFAVESELEAIAAHLEAPPPRPSREGAPRALDAVVERAMSKDPDRRYRSAGDLGLAATAAVEGRRPSLTERTVATGTAAPAPGVKRPRRRRRSTRATLAVGATTGVALAALAAVAAFATGMFEGAAGGARSGPTAGEPIALQQGTDRLALLDGKVWVLQVAGGRLARVDPATGGAEYFSSPVDLGGGAFPAIATGRGSVWTTHAVTTGGVDRLDPETVQAIEHVPLPWANALSIGNDRVWATTRPGTGRGELVRIDPRTNAVDGPPVRAGEALVAVAAGADAVWVADEAANAVARVDPLSGEIVARVPVGAAPARLAVAPGVVWVANLGDSTLTRIDTQTNRAVGVPISLGKEIQDIAIASGRLWVASADATVTPLDVRTGDVTGPSVAVGRPPLSLAADRDELWVANGGDRTIQEISTRRS